MHASSQVQTKKTPKLATVKDLERIGRTWRQLAGTGSLSRLERRWLAFFVALIRLHYDGIYAPVDAICRAQYRSQGETKSDASYFRAARALERKGYIRRDKFRVGADRFNAKIYFNLEAFSYWTRQPQSYIAAVDDPPADRDPARDLCQDHNPDRGAARRLEPEPGCVEVSDKDLQLSYCEQDKVPSAEHCSNSGSSFPKGTDKPARAKRLERTLKRPKKRERDNPVYYSLRIVTAGKGKARRRVLLALALLELTRPDLRQSGVDWQKWLEPNPQTGKIHWLELSIPEREAVALEQILPALESFLEYGAAGPPDLDRLVDALSGKAAAPAPVSESTLRRMLSGTPIGKALKTPCEASQGVPKYAGLPPDDLALLRALDEKAKSRVLE